jgi:hypothetical protein
MPFKAVRRLGCAVVIPTVLALPGAAFAATVGNPLCPGEEVLFNPGNGEDIVVPDGFAISVFAKGLNFPTGIAFRGNSHRFEVYVLESGAFPASRCNDGVAWQTKGLPGNPFTPDVLVFDQNAKPLRILGKPTDAATASANSFQPGGSAVDIAFEHGPSAGRLFASDNGSSGGRISILDPLQGSLTALITRLPGGPTGQLAFQDGWVYWGSGATTNSGVVDFAGSQPDVPCQDVTLSQNVFEAGDGTLTSGYSPFGKLNPGGTIPAFFDGNTGKTRPGVCNGAVLRARLSDMSQVEPFSWGYRNGYAIRFAPHDHPLAGGLLVGEDGTEESGARPANNAPEVLHLARQNPDGTPDYHGWPDRYGFLPSSLAVFNPVGAIGDALCVPDPSNPPSMCSPASLQRILTENLPVRDILAFPPQQISSPLAIEAPNSSFTAIDFAPGSFLGGPVKTGAALYTLEGDFGFSAANATPPALEAGHEVKVINFGGGWGQPPALNMQRFAHNTTSDQAFVDGISGFNRPTNVRFGPDGCAYIADYGVIRDFGQSDPQTGVKSPADAALVQIPGTGVIWKICRQ